MHNGIAAIISPVLYFIENFGFWVDCSQTNLSHSQNSKENFGSSLSVP